VKNIMGLDKTLRIIVGVLLLINTVTIFALLFLEVDSLVVMFNFDIDLSASNLGEAIANLAVGIAAAIFFLIAMIIVGIINVIIYTVFGALTLALKRSKTMPILVTIFSGLALFIGGRALFILMLAELPTIIMPLRVISDVVVIGMSITSIILTFRADKIPRIESTS
jgi:hypothetical protein